MKDTNPFSPTFGVSPPVLAGRHSILSAFDQALEGGIGSPGRAALYVGGRGSGKTVLLNEVEDHAARRGWLTVSETAAAGLVTRLTDHRLPLAARDALGEDPPSRRLASIGAFGFAVSCKTDPDRHRSGDVRSMLAALATEMEERGAGLLLTLDELQGADRDELTEVATAVQHLFRERRPIAVVAGGLPAVVRDQLLDDPVLTFFRRAERHHLGTVTTFEASDALQETASGVGRPFEAAALRVAAEATGGYPFMIQLVGHHAWRASDGAERISSAHVAQAVPLAADRLGALVLEPALADLSPNDRRFLLAMAVDEGPSRIAAIAERLDTSANQASQYRIRLLGHELITAPTRGVVDIGLPYLRAYLREFGALGEEL